MLRQSSVVILPKRSVSFAATQTVDDMEADDSEIRTSPPHHDIAAADMDATQPKTQLLLTPDHFTSTPSGESDRLHTPRQQLFTPADFSSIRRSSTDGEHRRSFDGSQSAVGQMNLLFSDSSYAPPSFTGLPTQDAEKWLKKFNYYIAFRGLLPASALQLFKLLLTDTAADWLESIPEATKTDWSLLQAAFNERFAASDIYRWQKAAEVWSRQQSDTESVDCYMTDVMNKAKRVPIDDVNLIRFAIIKGLKASIKQHVLQSGANDLDSVMKAARIAEAAAIQVPTASPDVATLSKEIKDLVSVVKEITLRSRPSTPERVASLTRSRSPSPSYSRNPRRVSFADDRSVSPSRQQSHSSRPSQQQSVASAHRDWSADRYFPAPPPAHTYNSGSTNFSVRSRDSRSHDFRQFCGNCGRVHPPNRCPAYGLRCYGCSRMHHIRRMCRSTRTYYSGPPRNSDNSH
jgi:hypothetical protein